jgi:hypothetical protein
MTNLTYEIVKDLYDKYLPLIPKLYIMNSTDFDKLNIKTTKRRKNYYEINGTGSFILVSEHVQADKILCSTINLINMATA